MLKDRFNRVCLSAIAALLLLNLIWMMSHGRAGIESTAQAQLSSNGSSTLPNSSSGSSTASANRVRSVGGFKVTNLQSVTAVGDGRSFVVSTPESFMVYQVEAYTSNP